MAEDAPAVASDPATLALFALRVRVFASEAEVAARAGVTPAVAAELLAELDVEGLVVHRETTARSGWRLTRDGRAEGARRWRAEALDAGLDEAIEEGYRRFRALNRPFLEVCTQWQVADLATGAINDHADPERDATVLEELARIDAEVGPVCDRLTTLLQRYGWYRPRFSSALARAKAGDVEAVAAPLSDSFHTTWFELHEDLLVTLDLDRASERTDEPHPDEPHPDKRVSP